MLYWTGKMLQEGCGDEVFGVWRRRDRRQSGGLSGPGREGRLTDCPGAHLEAIRRNGLVLESRHGTFAIPVEAEDAEHCSCRPDVILLCVKGYSLAETVPALKRLCDAHTIVIPHPESLWDGGTAPAGAGPRLVTDGCIYIAAEIKLQGPST